MKGLKIYIPDELDIEARELAMRRFGFRKGSLSNAVGEALTQWLKREEKIESKLNSLVSSASSDADVIAVAVFGSYARMDPAYNDVDIALIFKDGADFFAKYNKYSTLLEDRFANIDPLFDLSIFNELPLNVKHKVFAEGKMIYVSDKEELYRIAIKTMLEWADFKPILEKVTAQ